MLIVHDTDSIDDETYQMAFSQSLTEMRGGNNSLARCESIRMRSCDNAELGVILSEYGQQPGGIHMDEITAEVDEREEYSNDFESESVPNRGSLVLAQTTQLLSPDPNAQPQHSSRTVTAPYLI